MNFNYHDVRVQTYEKGIKDWKILTHKPTGIVIEGQDSAIELIISLENMVAASYERHN